MAYQDSSYLFRVYDARSRGFTGLLKRALDVSAALILLPVVLLVLLPAAIAIRTTSAGPLLFRQTRYGKDKVTFTIFKLRTMTVCEDGKQFRQATQGDARVTHVGRFLRATSIDELPQIFNVLKGNMSLVGPRPHPTKLDDDFRPLIDEYDERFGAKPGITGLAQVRGQRGPTETVEIMRARVASDVEYVARQSVLLDLRILLATIGVVLIGKNAF
ncbi:MAG: sugar transferase [Dinoroseobacter sp.]|nr:sugar transferase [Dinoroseobacter sp.]